MNYEMNQNKVFFAKKLNLALLIRDQVCVEWFGWLPNF